MGYFTIPGGGTGTDHQHVNKAVLDALTDAGSGAVITAPEREKLNAPFEPPPETAAIMTAPDPAPVSPAATVS